MLATPLGFLLSLVGVIMGKDRAAGILGMIISGALVLLAVCSMR